MRDPLIEVYGEERFAAYNASWVDIMEEIYNANKGNICNELLKDIKCPTFILYGQKDPLVDSVHASHLHTHISGSRYRNIIISFYLQFTYFHCIFMKCSYK